MKTYNDVLKILKESGENKLYVAVIHPSGRHEWLPVDKTEYIHQLSTMGTESAKTVLYPCYFEIEPSGEMFIHPKFENR